MRLTSNLLLVPIAVIVVSVLFWFRPGGIEGPRVAPQVVTGKGFDHSLLTQVLSRVVTPDGRVDYGALRDDPSLLDRYLGQIRAVSPGNAPHRFRSNDARVAYYLNAYNAFSLAGIRDHCPIDSVESIYAGGGFFWRVSFIMGEQEITLSTLESKKISGVVRRNPLVRLALNRGGVGAPPVVKEAFTEENLPAQLEKVGQTAVRTRRFVRREGKILKVSEFFKQYEQEFEKPAEWIRRYAPDLVENSSGTEFIPFDWSLNGDCGS